MTAQRWISAAVLAGAVLASACPSWGGSTRTLFLSGQAAPAGLTFASFGRAATNTRGTVCFLAGWDSFRHRPEGLYMRQGDQVVPIVRAGDPVPGHPDEWFHFPSDGPDEFTLFSLNDQDQVAFIVQQGLYLFAGGAPQPLARIGDAVPGAPDEVWDEVDAVSINNSGTVAFVGAIRSTTDGDRHAGVFLVNGPSVQIALFEGDQVTGLDGDLSGFSSVALNDAGQIATLAQEGENYANCVLLTSGTDTQVLAVEGGASPDGVWTELDSAALNNAGAVAFLARTKADTGEHGGIYLASGDVVTAVALPGQTVSGAGTLGDGLARPVLDDADNVAFVGTMVGSGGPQLHALVFASDSQLAALAVEGQAGPGELKGAIAGFAGLNLNSMADGTVVCGTTMRGGSISDSILQYSSVGAPGVLLTTSSPLPPGSLLTLADEDTAPSEVQAHTNARDELVFAADVGGYGRALFQAGSSGPKLLTPLAQGVRSISAFDLNEAGQLAFLAAEDEADQNTALFTTTLAHPEAAVEIVSTGDPAPTSSAELIRRLGSPLIDRTGGVIFAVQAQAEGAATTTLLLRYTGGQRALVASAGEAVTGVGKLAELPDSDPSAESNLFRELQLSRDGSILFLSSYQEDRTGSYALSGLFLLTNGVIRAVALPGQSSPLSSGGFYSSFTTPRLSDGGAVTFAASVVGPGRKSHAALFRLAAQTASTLALAGDPAPGLDATQFRAFLDPAVNGAGHAAFYALLDPSPAGGAGALFAISGGTLRFVLRDVDLVDPASGSTVRIDYLPSLATLSLRDDGAIFVAARLRGGATSSGLFLVQP
jgi:hypothetical protein